MRDTASTSVETSVVLHDAANALGDALQEPVMYPDASVSEVVRHLRRLLVDAAVTAKTGNQGNISTLLLALTDVRDGGQRISRTADAAIEQLLTEHPELTEHYREAVRAAGRDQGATDDA